MYSKKQSGPFITIYEWMISELGLGGDELIVYACIYGFNRGTGSDFFGSVRYLTRWTSASPEKITDALGKLTVKGYITRKPTHTPDGKTFYKYFATRLEEKPAAENKYAASITQKAQFQEIEDDDIDDLFPY